MPRLCVLALVAVCCATGCAGFPALATSLSPERLAAGAAILDGSLAAAASALAVAKAAYPDHAAAIESRARPILVELSAAVAAFKAATAPEAQARWETAWRLASVAASERIPVAVEAAVSPE